MLLYYISAICRHEFDVQNRDLRDLKKRIIVIRLQIVMERFIVFAKYHNRYYSLRIISIYFMHFCVFNFVHKCVKVHNLRKRIITNHSVINTLIASNFWKPWDLRGERNSKKRRKKELIFEIAFRNCNLKSGVR